MRLSGSSESSESQLGRRSLLILGALSAVPRFFNLGTSSMWSDEILITRETSGTLGDYWKALQTETYPPLDGFLTWLQLKAGFSESLRRCLPAALGVLTILLFAHWASQRFGRRTGWVFGLLAAFSPIHIHYSQELRAYSLALFFMGASLWSFDRVLRTDSRRNWALLGLALLGCLYTLYFAAVIFFVIGALALEGVLARDRAQRTAGRRLLLRLAVLGGLLAIAYLPWMKVARTMTSWRIIKDARVWDVPGVLQRWEHLTVGGLEGDPATWRVWLPLAVFLLGSLVALRRPAGRALLVGALVGTVGIEVLLWAEHHWSNDRYSLMGWPFICLILALGVTSVGDRWKSRRLAVAGTVAVLVALIALQLPRIERYYTRGRPNWDWMARTVASMARPGDTVIAANEWTLQSLGYYSARLEGVSESFPIALASESPHTKTERGCSFLVAGGWPSPGPVIRALSPQATLVVDSGGLGSRLYRLTEYSDEKSCVWMPRSDHRWRPPAGVSRFFPPAAPHDSELAIDFDPEFAGPHLLDGWSRFEVDPQGEHYVWAIGERAVLALGGLSPEARALTVELWTLAIPGTEQRVDVLLNGRLIAEEALPGGLGRMALETRAEDWSEEENLLVFNFAQVIVPSELDPTNPDTRALAAAFRRLDLKPLSSGESASEVPWK